jgi:hypothetical protein
MQSGGVMSKLSDEPFEKLVDDKDLEGFEINEEVVGVVQCACGYWGKMDGIIQWNNKKDIVFICPTCKSVERVRNPEWRT